MARGTGALVLPSEITLHIGLHKTATSLVQRSLRGLRTQMAVQGVAYVDFSRELTQNHPGGSSAEELTVYSLSNTLIANFPAIKMVRILVEGREIPSIAGHLDLTLPYGRGPEYLKPASERTGSRPEIRNEAS